MATMAVPLSRDGELVERILGGDRRAFGEVLHRHDDRLRGLAYKLLGADRHRMDDVMQEAYLKAFTSLSQFRRDAELGSWLYRIVYNGCIDELRRSARRGHPVDVELAAAQPATRPGPERVVGAADEVSRALAALPDDQRVTVVLVDGEGFDNVTAARLLDVAPGTIASRLSRARTAIRHTLGEEDR